MDLLTSPSSTLHFSQQQTMSSSSSSSPPHQDNTFARKLESFVRVTITCIIAAVGSVVGAVTGGLIGLATESGLLRGAGIGAISGAVFTIEAVESSLAIWHANNSGLWSILYLIDIACSLFNGRLVREKVGPAMRSAVESQMSEMDSPLMDAIDIFDTGGAAGMTRDSVDKLPIISVTSSNNADGMGDRVSCVVCLQDFEIGEAVRCLPHCHHMFHLPCIDVWLIKNGSCPLCRRDF